MSKSKRNTVDPAEIIEVYGVDAARLFMLSDSPPERDLEWTEAGIDGAWRYLNRALAPGRGPAAGCHRPVRSGRRKPDAPNRALRRLIHRTIAGVDARARALPFQQGGGADPRAVERAGGIVATGLRRVMARGARDLVRLLEPMVPHLAEELWEQLGHDARCWPTPPGPRPIRPGWLRTG